MAEVTAIPGGVSPLFASVCVMGLAAGPGRCTQPGTSSVTHADMVKFYVNALGATSVNSGDAGKRGRAQAIFSGSTTRRAKHRCALPSPRRWTAWGWCGSQFILCSEGLAAEVTHSRLLRTIPHAHPTPLSAANSRRSVDLRRRSSGAGLLGNPAARSRSGDAPHARHPAQPSARVRRHGHRHRGAPRHHHGAGRRHRHRPQEHDHRRPGRRSRARQEIRKRRDPRPDHRRARHDHPPGHRAN